VARGFITEAQNLVAELGQPLTADKAGMLAGSIESLVSKYNAEDSSAMSAADKEDLAFVTARLQAIQQKAAALQADAAKAVADSEAMEGALSAEFRDNAEQLEYQGTALAKKFFSENPAAAEQLLPVLSCISHEKGQRTPTADPMLAQARAKIVGEVLKSDPKLAASVRATYGALKTGLANPVDIPKVPKKLPAPIPKYSKTYTVPDRTLGFGSFRNFLTNKIMHNPWGMRMVIPGFFLLGSTHGFIIKYQKVSNQSLGLAIDREGGLDNWNAFSSAEKDNKVRSVVVERAYGCCHPMH
jgi:hypothetical protein